MERIDPVLHPLTYRVEQERLEAERRRERASVVSYSPARDSEYEYWSRRGR